MSRRDSAICRYGSVAVSNSISESIANGVKNDNRGFSERMTVSECEKVVSEASSRDKKDIKIATLRRVVSQ